MSKYTAQCLFFELDALQKQVVDVNNKLRAERKRYYATNRGALPTMEQFKKEIGS